MSHRHLLLALMVFVAVEAKNITNAQENVISQAKLVFLLPSPSITTGTSVSVYPSELFFGDTCYCQITRANQTKKPFHISNTLPITCMGLYNNIRFVISTKGIAEDYTILPEVDHYMQKSFVIGTGLLQPGGSLVSSWPLELPPLEAMEHPFWKKLRKKMTPEGVKCVLSVKLPGIYIRPSHPSSFITETGEWIDNMWTEEYQTLYREYRQSIDFIAVYEHEITIKPRPEQEQVLLDNWLRDIPKQFLPHVSKIPMLIRDWYPPEWATTTSWGGYRYSGDHFVEIDSEKYNPWCFIRDGNRKPPATACPTTLEGWQKLENSLKPSTMRDEIQLTRMLIDYLSAKGDVQAKKREELVEWLKSLPGPQSMSMASNLADFQSMYGMYGPGHQQPGYAEALEPSYRKLVREICPLMSYYHKQKFECFDEILKKREANKSEE